MFKSTDKPTDFCHIFKLFLYNIKTSCKQVSTDVEISDQFFAWVCGFGKKAKIIGHDGVVEEFKAYLDKIRETY